MILSGVDWRRSWAPDLLKQCQHGIYADRKFEQHPENKQYFKQLVIRLNDKRTNIENFLSQQCFLIILSCKFVNRSYFLPVTKFNLIVILNINVENHMHWQKIL